jgi:proteic killer suppression protein
MIKSFADKRTAALFLDHPTKDLPADIRKRARAKLMAIDQAQALDDLRSPPANRLEALRGGRAGQYSIRVNDRWRICLVWQDGDAYDVEFLDYH